MILKKWDVSVRPIIHCLFRLPIQGDAEAQMRKGTPHPQYIFYVKLKVYIFVPKFQCNFYINFNATM